MELFKLVGSIMVDSSDAENSLSKTDEKATSVAEKLNSGVATAAKWGTAIADAAVSVGSAMVGTAKDTAAQMDVIDKASQRMGIAAESYQELAYAAEMSGVSMSALETAAKKLDGTDLNLDDAMNSIMSITDAEERAAAAAELFGDKVAYEMTPLLNAGQEGFEAMKQEANDLGLVMSGDAVKAGADMGDTFAKLEKSVGALKDKVGVALMPVISDVINTLLDFMPTITQMVDKLAPIITELLDDVGGELMDMIKEILPPLLDLLDPLLKLIIAIAKPLMNLLTAILKPIISVVSDFCVKVIPKIVDGIGLIVEAVKKIGEKIKEVWNGIKNSGFVQFLSSIGSGIASLFGGGSHASGLAYVPYDGYQATLHRGETVLNSNDASQILNEVRAIANSRSNAMPSTITVISQLDGREVARNQYDYLSEIGMLRGAVV